MQIITPDSRGRTAARSDASASVHTAHRRGHAHGRRSAAGATAALHEAKLSAASRAKIADAVEDLLRHYRQNTITRQHIESEQRDDETRLAGLAAAPPLPGTRFDGVEDTIRYRMAVRARALEQIASLQLTLLDSTSSVAQVTAPTPKPKRWGTAR